MRRSAPAQTLIVVASVLDQAQRLDLAGLDISPGTYWDLLADEAVDIDTHVELGPYQVRWLDAQAADVAEP